MTETELFAFIKNPSNRESEILEYKLKPNFNEINESIKEIQDKIHFKILKTIYAFANTKGGELYIGITDEKSIEGIDSCDKKIVEQKILKRVSPIIRTEKEDIQLKNGRIVIKIKVHPLKIDEKPLFADGILYVRGNDTTKAEKSLKNYLSLYRDKQLYMCYVRGIKSNLKKLEEQNNFEVQQFIEGLKIHIRSFIEKTQITGYERELNEAENLLDQIINYVNLTDDSRGDLPVSRLNLDSLIDKFIGIYKNIISKG